MNKIKILVVEDEMVIAENICFILEDIGYEVLEPAIDFEEAIETIEAQHPDIAILDIQLAGTKDGLDLAETIQKKYQFPYIFLTSNSDAHTIERVKNVEPYAFLVKPFRKEDLYASLELAIHAFNTQKALKPIPVRSLLKDCLFIKEKNLYHKVKIQDIEYIKSDHVYLEVNVVKGRKFIMRGSISEMSERLPANFYRTHRSYIVNLDYLTAINSAYLIINDAQVPIGKNYREQLLSNIKTD